MSPLSCLRQGPLQASDPEAQSDPEPTLTTSTPAGDRGVRARDGQRCWIGVADWS
jgi:hypothetical protein